MNATQILEVIAKGFTLIEALRQATEAASPAIKAVYDLIDKYKSGTVITEADLIAVEQVLDEQLTAFNEPLPED